MRRQQIAASPHCEVVGLPAATCQRLHRLGFKRKQTSRRGTCCQRAKFAQGLRQLHRLRSFAGAQVAIARRQRQAIWRALGFPRQNLNGQRELLHHAAHHQHLLVILLSERGHARRHAGEYAAEKLQHHRADADEKAGPKVAFQDIAQVAGRMHAIGLRLRIELLLARRKQHIAASRLQPLGVGGQRARVAVEVFVRRKLQPVDEDARDGDIAQRPGLP